MTETLGKAHDRGNECFTWSTVVLPHYLAWPCACRNVSLSMKTRLRFHHSLLWLLLWKKHQKWKSHMSGDYAFLFQTASLPVSHGGDISRLRGQALVTLASQRFKVLCWAAWDQTVPAVYGCVHKVGQYCVIVLCCSISISIQTHAQKKSSHIHTHAGYVRWIESSHI